MLKLFVILSLNLSLITPGYSQNPVEKDVVVFSQIVDSLIHSFKIEETIQRHVYGSVAPFQEVSGTVFLSRESSQIIKAELEVENSEEIVVYYFTNNHLQLIVTSGAVYFMHDNRFRVFHSLEKDNLLSELDLQAQLSFSETMKQLFIKQRN